MHTIKQLKKRGAHLIMECFALGVAYNFCQALTGTESKLFTK